MASTTQDELYRQFLDVVGRQSAAIGDSKSMLVDVIAQLQEVRSGTPATATGKTTASTQTKAQSSSVAQSSAQTTPGGSTAGSVASTILNTGFGLAPLISGIIGLFGGGEPEPPPALVKYALPGSINFQAAESNSRLTSLDYDQMGMARSFSTARAEQSVKSEPGVPANQITVNVQAMDARSFLDRSNDIALAVRDAMLNLNAINDVVNEL